jgi:hypothetical protein
VLRATVAIPWREGPGRLPAFERCTKYWREHGFPVVTADSDPDKPFLCNQARNLAVAKADTDIVIMADGDTIPQFIDTIQVALDYVERSPDYIVWPFTRYRYLDEFSVDEEDLEHIVGSPQPQWGGLNEWEDMSGGILVFNTKAFWDLGGYDENFTPGCWGYDDLAFHKAAETLGKTVRLQGLAYSFDHPAHRDMSDKNPNKRRYNALYAPAIGNSNLMRKVIGK